MKILQVNKYLYRKAGAEAYMLDLAELLIEKGHEVALWGCNNQSIIPNSYFIIHDGLLVKYLNFDRREGWRQDIKKVGHMVWSLEAARKFGRVLTRFKPDIIHIHNIYHHISPSILPVAKKYGIPVVMSVHDYSLINPNYTLYDHSEICERQGLSAVFHRCIQDSFFATLAGITAFKIHQWLGVYKKNIACYIAPTEFIKQKLTGGGIPSEKIMILPLPVILNGAERSEESRSKKHGIPSASSGQALRSAQDDSGVGYILFAGRLTEEKGVYLLLEIAKQLPDIQFKIAGDGPAMSNVKCQMSNVTNVELLGFVKKENLQKLIAEARLVVAPSLWYDPSPYAVLEAMAAGKVVLASRIGGISDLIKDGETGFLINCVTLSVTQHPVLVGQWVDAIKKIYYDEPLLWRVGQVAQEQVQRVNGTEQHYERLIKIYETILNNIITCHIDRAV